MQTVTVTNNGTFGGCFAHFHGYIALQPGATVTNPCGTSLAAGASCSVGVVFAPAIEGSFTGTLTIASPSLASPAVVPLSGTGGVPGSVRVPAQSADLRADGGRRLTSGASTVTITNPDSVTGLQQPHDHTPSTGSRVLKVASTAPAARRLRPWPVAQLASNLRPPARERRAEP
jgi:hypothetical protein